MVDDDQNGYLTFSLYQQHQQRLQFLTETTGEARGPSSITSVSFFFTPIFSDYEPPSFSLGLDFGFESELQTAPPPSSTPPLPADTDLDQVPEPQIEPPRALRRLKRGLPEKRELPTTPFWSVEDDIEEFSSPEDTVQVCSAVGVLPLSLQYGFSLVEKFLKGASSIDQHFHSAPFEKNIPVLLGSFGNMSQFTPSSSSSTASINAGEANVDDKAPLWIFTNKIEKLPGGGSWREKRWVDPIKEPNSSLTEPNGVSPSLFLSHRRSSFFDRSLGRLATPDGRLWQNSGKSLDSSEAAIPVEFVKMWD
ncbi:hypothetical protein ACLB2K_053128 [Fragaria x ananassa]